MDNTDITIAWSPFPVLTTQRLTLRQIVPGDAPDHFRLYSNVQVMAAHGTPPYTTITESEERIARHAQAVLDQKAIRWAVTRHDEGRLLGTCGFHSITRYHYRAEIGYELHPDYWQMGIMSEAVRAIVQFGFTQMNLHRIEAIVDPTNAASAALLRRVGFTEEGYLRERFYDNGRFVDDWFFALLRHEFEDQKG